MINLRFRIFSSLLDSIRTRRRNAFSHTLSQIPDDAAETLRYTIFSFASAHWSLPCRTFCRACSFPKLSWNTPTLLLWNRRGRNGARIYRTNNKSYSKVRYPFLSCARRTRIWKDEATRYIRRRSIRCLCIFFQDTTGFGVQSRFVTAFRQLFFCIQTWFSPFYNIMLSSHMHRLRYIKKTEITFGLSVCLFGFFDNLCGL